MGNNSTKLAEKCSILSKSEVPLVAGSFKFVSKNSDKIKEDDLMKFWGSQMDPRLAQYITNFLFGAAGNRSPHADFQRFAELYVYCVRGTLDERINVILASLGKSDSDGGCSEIAYPLIKEFVEAVVSSYMRSIRLEAGRQYKSWESKGFRIVKECVQKLAESLAHGVVQQDTQKVTRADAERWLNENVTFTRMLENVFRYLFQYRASKHSQQQTQTTPQYDNEPSPVAAQVPSSINSLLPFCEGLQYVPDYPAFTDISQMLFINEALPTDHRHKWRFLFSSQIHGDSFSTLLGRIVDQGPSVVIVEDTDGYIYGAFASANWSFNAKFVGDENAFLFSLRPKMRVMPTTNYNKNYQYMNQHQQTLPNGLGFGGQFGYWGLWLDSDYGKGECSTSCTTYRNYFQLSANKNFNIRHIEVWGVGDKPVKSDDDMERSPASILSGNSEEKALLEMVGRRQYSDGLRDDDTKQSNGNEQ